MTAGADSGQLREVDAATQAHGLVIYRASRLEALLPPLRQLLAATPPHHVLAPQTLIAAHPGMKQWLHGALAREYGAGGIVANLDILLPSAWIDRLAQQRLGQQAVALPRYQRAHLRWTIHAALVGNLRALGVTDARITAYLHAHGEADAGTAADLARRRFQLADRLAGLFSQYLVYRPDWLRAWENGRYTIATGGTHERVAASTEQHLLGPLWRHVRARLGAHRGDVVADLIASVGRVSAQGAEHAALHVFGVSHLAPSELAVLRAFAQQHLVALYVPDPCREYWGGLARELPGLRARRVAEVVRLEQAAGNDYWVEQPHPLLASWGRMGQHFIMALADSDGDVLEDVRHWQDAQPAPAHDRLGRVQQGIRELRPQLMTHPFGEDTVQAERADASLRIHACHTPLRELEVLRDQLLDAMATSAASGAAIKPSDIVVMAPDIQAYVPLIASVFGVAGDSAERLPYHLADVAVARSHGLFGAFRRLLDLPSTRVTAPEVVDLLAVPEVARRLNLDAAGLDELVQWLRRSRVAWALDPAFRARFGVPPIAAHTFGWAMDRMLGGYLLGDAATDAQPTAVRLPDGSELAPLEAMHGPAASHLGALDQLLGEVQNLCDLAARSLPASAWAVALERRYEALFRIDPTDRAARDAQAQLLRFIRNLATEPESAGEDPLLHFAVVRDLLVARLSAAPERQRFLMGGITFCGMVPQRAIPFKMVAVLGLNDGEFPRAGSDSGIDLMARFRRLGDRDVRSDDRYLFLETLMSARTRLHLSYLGEGVRDGKPRNPAAPLAELMSALDGAGLPADDALADRPWLVHHPLQPFDARYFNSADPRLFSYSAAFAAMHGRATTAAVAPFLDRSMLAALPEGNDGPDSMVVGTVPLRELAAYFKDPAAQLLRQHLQLSLDALEDDRLPQHEPLTAAFLPLDGVAKKLFFNDCLAAGVWSLEQPPAWLRLGGIMPPGQPGEDAWLEELTALNALLAQAQVLPGFAHAAPVASRRPVDVHTDRWRITGQIEHVFVSTVEGAVQWQLLRPFPTRKGKLKDECELDFKDRVPMFLDWALLRLHSAGGSENPPSVRLRALVAGTDRRWQDAINAWDAQFIAAPALARPAMLATLETRVAQLLDWWHAAQAAPRWYFPRAAWATIKPSAYPKPAKSNAPEVPDDDGPHGAREVADPHAATVSVGQVWISGFNGGGERSYAPGYSHLLAGDVEFAEGSIELAELHAFAQRLHACISFDLPLLGSAP